MPNTITDPEAESREPQNLEEEFSIAGYTGGPTGGQQMGKARTLTPEEAIWRVSCLG